MLLENNKAYQTREGQQVIIHQRPNTGETQSIDDMRRAWTGTNGLNYYADGRLSLENETPHDLVSSIDFCGCGKPFQLDLGSVYETRAQNHHVSIYGSRAEENGNIFMIGKVVYVGQHADQVEPKINDVVEYLVDGSWSSHLETHPMDLVELLYKGECSPYSEPHFFDVTQNRRDPQETPTRSTMLSWEFDSVYLQNLIVDALADRLAGVDRDEIYSHLELPEELYARLTIVENDFDNN